MNCKVLKFISVADTYAYFSLAVRSFNDISLLSSNGILSVSINSNLGDKLPNFVEGSTVGYPFKVGSYKSHGADLKGNVNRGDSIFVRPPTPSGVPPMPQCMYLSYTSYIRSTIKLIVENFLFWVSSVIHSVFT